MVAGRTLWEDSGFVWSRALILLWPLRIRPGRPFAWNAIIAVREDADKRDVKHEQAHVPRVPALPGAGHGDVDGDSLQPLLQELPQLGADHDAAG